MGGVVVAGDELMSVVALPVVPEAPMDVPLPVEPLAALLSVLGVGVVVLLLPAVVSVGGVAGAAGTVVLEDEEVDDGTELSVAGRSPQADRARAAIRARAALRAM